MTPTLKTISEIVGVSVPVVAKVLNKTQSNVRVSSAVADKIRQTSRELGYQRNFAAAAMASKSTRLIGVHIQEGASGGVTGPLESAFLRGVESVCEVTGHDVLLVSIPGPNAISHSLLHLRQGRVDGLLIVLTQVENASLQPFVRFARRVLVAGCPHVPRGLKTIQLCNADAVRIACEHLEQLGHERIGFIGSCVLPEMIDSTERWRGFREARGVEADRWVFWLGTETPPISMNEDYCLLEGIRGVSYLMDRPLADRPTAIIAHNDQVAMAAILELTRRGLRVSRDVSIMGIGNEPFSRLGIPSISTVTLPFKDFGVEAAIQLLKKIIPPEEFPGNIPSVVTLAPQLVARESTARRIKR